MSCEYGDAFKSEDATFYLWLCLTLGVPIGWSTDCLQEWGSYMQLAVPSTLMVCFEWWVWEIGSFLAGQYLCVFVCVFMCVSASNDLFIFHHTP